MPIYEFQCNNCGKIEERLIAQGDKPSTVCSHCGGKTKQIMSITNFSLRGGGWSKDGYRNGEKERRKD